MDFAWSAWSSSAPGAHLFYTKVLKGVEYIEDTGCSIHELQGFIHSEKGIVSIPCSSTI